MEVTGNIDKMEVEGIAPVSYRLPLNDQRIEMNTLIGSSITIRFTGQINCVNCGRGLKKAYGQGFCYQCFSESPENAECIIRPEVCEGHLGKGRDPQWEYDHHVQEHYVYLAHSGGAKVGITRTTQIPTRWIDQGACKAVIFAKVPYRKLAGMIEVELKKHISDKTNWQKMLCNELDDTDLYELKERMRQLLPEELQDYILPEAEIMEIGYPLNSFPEKIQSVSLDKVPEITGKLMGIKGQYLVFDDGRAMNVRSHSGYQVTFLY